MSTETTIAVLELAIQTEREGRRFYEEAAQRTRDPDGQRIFTSLADDERMHEQVLQKELNRLQQGQSPEPVELGPPAAPVFPRERLEGEIREYTGELAALRTGYLIENDAVNFYARAAEREEDPVVKDLFRTLADWEREHRRILQDAYRFLSAQFEREMGFEPF